MKKTGTYILSLIISVLMVFVIIISSIIIISEINITEQKNKKLFNSINIYSMVRGELQKYFAGQSNTTGIPAEIYMTALGEDYIITATDGYAKALFESLSGKNATAEVPRNEALENNINDFFSDYAERNNFEKDDIYENKISSSIDNAYEVIGNYCDVYKYSSLNKHGVLSKISKIYVHLGIFKAVCAGMFVFLFMLLVIINRKNIYCVLYWFGVSAFISGIFGTVPTAYLLATDYFDSFVIKQPQVFRAFTGAMYAFSESVMKAHVVLIAVGLCFVIIYGILCKINNKK